MKWIFFLGFSLTVHSFLTAQNLLPEWHREHVAEEAWSIAKVAGIYENDSLGISITLEEDDGRLRGTIKSPFSEGFLMFDEARNTPLKKRYRDRATHLVEGWVHGNDWEIYDIVGGRWFDDSTSTDRYVRYFKRTYESLHNDTDSVRSFRVLGTYKRDQWDKHGYSNDTSSNGTYVEINTWGGQTKYMGIGWQNKRPDHAAGWRFGDLNTRFTRTEMIFEPRTPSKFVAFDVVSDITVGVNFLPKGMHKKDYQEHQVTYCYVGNVRFEKVR